MTSFNTRFISRAWLAIVAALALASYSGGNSKAADATAGTTPALLEASARELTDAFASTLTGAEETPPVQSTARGSGTVVVNAANRQMIATVVTSGIVGTAAHIHQGAPGEAGPIVIPLNETAPGSGIWTATATLTEDQHNNLNSGNFYFNVHSTAFPDGEIRGQIVPQQAADAAGLDSRFSAGMPSANSFLASLKGQNEVPPTPSTAQGSGSALVDPATRQLVAAITTSGITGNAAHIHEGAPGVNGPIIVPLQESAAGSGIWIGSATLTEAQYNAFQQGNMYFNVHSVAFPDGEIRGQILPQMQFIAGSQAGGAETITDPGTNGS